MSTENESQDDKRTNRALSKVDKRDGPPPSSVKGGNFNSDRQNGLELTKAESRFALGVIRGNDPIEAARTAGFADPEISAYDLLGRPHVREAIRARVMRHVFGKLLPTALQAHEAILIDPTASAAAKMSAIKEVYALANLETEPEDENSGNRVPLSELSSDELRKRIADAEQAIEVLSNRAEPVNGS